jgi:hypothetical protein
MSLRANKYLQCDVGVLAENGRVNFLGHRIEVEPVIRVYPLEVYNCRYLEVL